MVFTQFHWGDWVRSTQDLTPLERGIYIDLLQRYYQKERPITDEECKRIARAYANAEQEAMQYVLQTFFTKDAEGYRNSRCDEEIAKANAVSAKRADAAKRSWESRNTQKKRVNPESRAKDEANATQTQYERNANAEQVQSNCNASALLTINHKPITNIDNPLNPPSQGEAPDGASVKPKRKWQGLMTDRPDDVPAADWDQWIQIRKLKKLPVTDLAIEKMREEAKSAGLTLDQAVRKCIESGWGGFKASYLEQKQNVLPKTDRLGTGNPDEYLPNSRLKRQECRVYKRGI